jgi:hypothetical protein
MDIHITHQINMSNLLNSEEKFALAAFQRDEALSERLKRTKKEIEKSHSNLLEVAQEYSNKYKEQVTEGTKRMQLLLTEGRRKGLSDEEILAQNGKFYPTVRTPILNLLFFLMQENPDAANEVKYNRVSNDVDGNYHSLRESHNRQFGSERYADEIGNMSKKTPEMDQFIYGSLTADEFQKLKKLKALSRSKNKNEAFAAYTKCMELCTKYKLNFDLIPCKVDE